MSGGQDNPIPLLNRSTDSEEIEAPLAADSIAVAVATGAAQASPDPAVHAELVAYLAEQRRLTEIQQSLAQSQMRLNEERLDKTAADRRRADADRELIDSQKEHLHLSHFREKLRLVFEVGLAIFGVTVIVSLVIMLAGAMHDRSIVVEPFEVPEALRQSGSDGRSLAASLIDEMNRLRTSNRSNADVQRGIADPNDEATVEVPLPEVHVSLAEFRRIAHETLGHRSHILGTVDLDGEHLRILIRGRDLPAKSFDGSKADLKGLIREVAEYVYGAEDPAEMARYLSLHERGDEAVEVARSYLEKVDTPAKIRLLEAWGRILAAKGDSEGAIRKYRRAYALSGNRDWNAWAYLSYMQPEEQLLQEVRAKESEFRRNHYNDKYEMELALQWADSLRGDCTSQMQTYSHTDVPLVWGSINTARANAAIACHDLDSARDAMDSVAYVGDSKLLWYDANNRWMIEQQIALELGDTAALRKLKDSIERFKVGSMEFDLLLNGGNYDRRLVKALSLMNIDFALGRMDDVRKSLAEIDATRSQDGTLPAAAGGNATDVEVIARIVYETGDPARAEKLLSHAIEVTPSNPHAYFMWGVLLLEHGQSAQALEKFAMASSLGPRWADPYEKSGEALVALHRYRQAIDAFGKAEPFSPNWGRLHWQYAQALEQVGDIRGALKHYRKADQLPIAEIDRQRIKARIAALQ